MFQSSQVLITAFQLRLQPFGKSLIFKISEDIKMCLAYLPMAQTGTPDRSLRRARDGLLRQEHSPDLRLYTISPSPDVSGMSSTVAE